jgi:hypothetical protein
MEIASQPFRLDYLPSAGAERSHTPDFFLRRSDGQGVVVDVRPDALVEPEDQESFEAAPRVCEHVGWTYRRVGELPRVYAPSPCRTRPWNTGRSCAGLGWVDDEVGLSWMRPGGPSMSWQLRPSRTRLRSVR